MASSTGGRHSDLRSGSLGRQQKICVVTGGASGLGRAIALTLAGQGMAVAIGDLQEDAGSEVVASMEDAGGTGAYWPLDVADGASVAGFFDHVLERFGRIDCAVNNAGIEGQKKFVADYPEDDWRRVVDVNLTGVFLCMKHELNAMLPNRSGSIVNVGSTASLRGTASMSAYTAAKHGIVGLTKSAALEYADRNIRINAVCPGSFRTPMSDRLNDGDFSTVEQRTPMKRVAPAEEIAESVVWLALGQATFITGVALPIDGGKLAGSPQ
ncbi:SDR family NAD(P)-dependent oxidoreductase [Microbaculum marinum]|uniref:SDR family NAD(P)-dependent oxidoreductase n=1 Tax=Microbaculum marinum TaxID=1764581 RepID=A0AAW9RQR1_9HYPH